MEVPDENRSQDKSEPDENFGGAPKSSVVNK